MIIAHLCVIVNTIGKNAAKVVLVYYRYFIAMGLVLKGCWC